MRKGWTEVTLDEVAIASWGNTTTTKSKYVPSGYLAYSASGADGYLDWFEHDCNGVILSAIGAQCGKTWFAHGKWTPIKNTIWIKGLKDKLLDQYLYYLSNRDQFWQIRGQAQPFISLGDVRTTIFLLPPIQEQKRIVDLISSVDSYIDALQKQADSARKSRNAVLHEMLSAGGDGWTEVTLGEISEMVRGPFGGSLKKEIFVEKGFAVYEQQHAIYGDFNKVRYQISQEKFIEMSRFQVKPGDLIMSCSGTMGRVVRIPKGIQEGIINQALLKISTNELVRSDYLELCMQSDDFQRNIKANSGGGALQNVSSVKLLKVIPIRIPSIKRQSEIVDVMKTIDDAISAIEVTLKASKNLRSGLLSDLLNGDHEIPSSYDSIIGAA